MTEPTPPLAGRAYDPPGADGAAVEERERLEVVLHAIRDGIVFLDRQWRVTFMNRVAAAELEDVRVGDVLWDAAPALRDTGWEREARRAVERGTERALEREAPWSGRWCRTRFFPTGDGVVLLYRDVTGQRAADSRRSLLEEATVLLASSRDYEDTLGLVAERVTSAFADVCAVYLTRPDGGVSRVALSVRGEDLRRDMAGFLALYDPSENRHGAIVSVVSGGETVHLTGEQARSGGERLRELPEARRLFERLRLGSMLVVPVLTRAELLGALFLARTDARPPFSGDEIALGEELARRAGMAVENGRLFREAEEARRAAESASRAKSDFLAVMSHELRTPLNAIVGYGDLLEGEVAGPVNEKQRSHLGRIRESAWHLLSLIDEILSLSRIEAGRTDLEILEVDGVELAEDAMALVEPQGRRKGLETEVAAGVDALPMETDAGKVRQVLLNLLSNAVKFTEDGSVRLEVEREGDRACFTVRDTGVGIEPGDLEAVFEPFTRRAPSSVDGGTGLGLTVSRRFVELLGGEISVASTPGRGSAFTVRLPLRTSPPEDAASRPAPAARSTDGRRAHGGGPEA